jgi:hypothetical protein
LRIGHSFNLVFQLLLEDERVTGCWIANVNKATF